MTPATLALQPLPPFWPLRPCGLSHFDCLIHFLVLPLSAAPVCCATPRTKGEDHLIFHFSLFTFHFKSPLLPFWSLRPCGLSHFDCLIHFLVLPLSAAPVCCATPRTKGEDHLPLQEFAPATTLVPNETSIRDLHWNSHGRRSKLLHWQVPFLA